LQHFYDGLAKQEARNWVSEALIVAMMQQKDSPRLAEAAP
jgi:hypothetical protein